MVKYVRRMLFVVTLLVVFMIGCRTDIVKAAVTQSGILGTCVWEYDDSTKVLTIRPMNNTYGELSASSSSGPWYSKNLRMDVTKIVVKQGVKANKDSRDLFLAFTNVIDIDLSGLDLSEVENISGMFAYCYKLKNITADWRQASSVKSIYRMFQSCNQIETINLAGLDVSQVTTFDNLCVFTRILVNSFVR